MTTYQLTHEGYVIKDGDTNVPTAKVPGIEAHPETLAYEAWLDAGNVPLPADPVVLTPAEIVARIQELEDQYLMPRITRETIIALAEERALAMGLTLEYLRTKNKGYAALKTLDEQIAALRSQMP